jgi:histidine triad (HIT) family protein
MDHGRWTDAINEARRRALHFVLRVARSCVDGPVIGWVFEYMSFAIPVKRLRETPSLIAFFHPQPEYPVHVLLVPKRAISGLADPSATDVDLLTDLLQVVQSLVAELGLEQRGYRLIVNGGAYQDIAQLHFHLVSGTPT